MNISEHNIQIEGHLLHRTIFEPSESKPKMACLFSHGQGDYSQRYRDVLHPFTERGIRCISVDLLGHGMSPGKRGHCGNRELIDQIIQSNLDLTDGLPHGIAGHSMGGLLTLRHLSLALEGLLPTPQFCWVNSPLLRPTHGKATWFVKMARYLAKRAPEFTIKTGATPELCQSQQTYVQPSARISSMKKLLGHQRVSLGWGVELINISNYIFETLPQLNTDIPFLFTQGDSDLICPHSIAEEFLGLLSFSNSTYRLFENMRHETFAEPTNQELFNTLSDWLAKNGLP